MKSYFQVLGLNTHLTSSSAMLFFDTSRYIFNSGDSLQRVINENKVRLPKMKDLFLTSISPNTISSLPGLMLSLMQLNSENRRTIHGPPGISAFIESACTFA